MDISSLYGRCRVNHCFEFNDLIFVFPIYFEKHRDSQTRFNFLFESSLKIKYQRIFRLLTMYIHTDTKKKIPHIIEK